MSRALAIPGLLPQVLLAGGQVGVHGGAECLEGFIKVIAVAHVDPVVR